ncbi:MAG: TonB-dependent receptor [Bacteroidetes bacterium]|nr:TonB-dependent receptor [Bacteroidota bacterium]
MRLYYVTIFLIFTRVYTSSGQVDTAQPYIYSDIQATQPLPEVAIHAYFREQPLLTSPVSVTTIGATDIATHQSSSLLSAVNTMPGVRMEERSPSSYRLSIRGSILRSPFGVRNIRVYLSDFCLTDAGGNTYLNLINPSDAAYIQVIKGPEGSVYGANTGGVMLIDPVQRRQDTFRLSAMAETGSYGYAQGRVHFQNSYKRLESDVALSYMRSDGYRRNSSSQQWTTQILERYRYSKTNDVKFLVLFTDLGYHTPGGLTLAQYNADPRAARPATTTLPGASDQKAAVYNQSILGGVSHSAQLSPVVKNVTALTVLHTGFSNPFITNYETRNENNVGIRTYFDWSGERSYKFKWSWVNGLEGQQFLSGITDFGNDRGVKDSVQTSYRFNAGQYYAFSRFTAEVIQRVTIEAGASINYNWYQYKALAPLRDAAVTNVQFATQVMPHVALAVKITDGLAWRASVSRGYSPPTIAEIHPSALVVSAGLQPEQGWNYETGIRYHDRRGIIYLDADVFYYQLDRAISGRTDSAGNNFFVNAGNTHQLGAEAQVVLWPVRTAEGRLHTGLKLMASYTYYHFRFGNYRSGAADYSGHYLTGVPPHTLAVNEMLDMPIGFYLFSQYGYTASLPLNDAGTTWARYYHLLEGRVGWKHSFKRCDLELYAAVNNLLDQKYSLGNDLNAAGGRYYNAAPGRNYYAGLRVAYHK